MRFYVKDEGDACRNTSVMSGHTGRQANMSLCIRFYDPDVSFVSEQAVSINGLTLRKHFTHVCFYLLSLSFLHQSGYIFNRGMPQLCLGVSDTRIEGKLFTRDTPVQGFAVCPQKRMTGNPNQIWRFATNGTISAEVRG